MDSAHPYVKNANVIEREVAGAPALIDPYRRTMLALDPVGADIWRLLDGTRPLAAVVDALAASYDVGRDVLYADVQAFIAELEKRELVG